MTTEHERSMDRSTPTALADSLATTPALEGAARRARHAAAGRHDQLPGHIIAARYRINSRIARGGMSTVYLARDLERGELFAVKVLLEEASGELDLRRRFFNEMEAIRRIDHPAVIKMHATGELPDGRLYIVMEYVRGTALKKLLERGPLSPAVGLPIASSIAEGLRAAHEKGVIHRDLKPGNILVPRVPKGGYRAKIIDFGIAVIAHTPRITGDHRVVGTPTYMSPEQATGRDFDHRADIYALGVVLHEMFSGSAPFRAGSAASMMEKHVSTLPPPLRFTAPDEVYPAEMEELVEGCLAKDPKDRPPSMDAVLLSLHALLEMFGLES